MTAAHDGLTQFYPRFGETYNHAPLSDWPKRFFFRPRDNRGNDANAIVEIGNLLPGNEERFYIVPDSGTQISKKSQQVIGRSGTHRFNEFARYKTAWDSGAGRALSSRSVAVMETFLGIVGDSIPTEPSIFLTRDGNLQLGWENSRGQRVELEFFPNHIEFFDEKSGIERIVPLSLTAIVDLNSAIAAA